MDASFFPHQLQEFFPMKKVSALVCLSATGLLLVGTGGCKTTSELSTPVESWDGQNGPELFGAEKVTYDLISKEEYKKGAVEHIPWTDTYWPLNRAGFAMRWIDTTKATPFALCTDVVDPDYVSKAQTEVQSTIEHVTQVAAGSWEQLL